MDQYFKIISLKSVKVGFSLIEILVTLTVMAILVAVAIANFSMVKSPKDLVNEATKIFAAACNQAAIKSLNNSTPQLICNVVAGSGAANASCGNAVDASGSAIWANINNINFDQRVIVQAANKLDTNKIIKIGYLNGIINQVKFASDVNDTIITSSNEINISPIVITIKFKSNPVNCFNTINLWPNNVMNISENCAKIDGTYS